MYNKIRKALDRMCYEYRECESCRLYKDIIVETGFIVNLRDRDVYLELTDVGTIDVWDLNTSEYLRRIYKAELYIMMFDLGSYLQFLDR